MVWCCACWFVESYIVFATYLPIYVFNIIYTYTSIRSMFVSVPVFLFSCLPLFCPPNIDVRGGVHYIVVFSCKTWFVRGRNNTIIQPVFLSRKTLFHRVSFNKNTVSVQIHIYTSFCKYKSRGSVFQCLWVFQMYCFLVCRWSVPPMFPFYRFPVCRWPAPINGQVWGSIVFFKKTIWYCGAIFCSITKKTQNTNPKVTKTIFVLIIAAVASKPEKWLQQIK